MGSRYFLFSFFPSSPSIFIHSFFPGLLFLAFHSWCCFYSGWCFFFQVERMMILDTGSKRDGWSRATTDLLSRDRVSRRETTNRLNREGNKRTQKQESHPGNPEEAAYSDRKEKERETRGGCREDEKRKKEKMSCSCHLVMTTRSGKALLPAGLRFARLPPVPHATVLRRANGEATRLHADRGGSILDFTAADCVGGPGWRDKASNAKHGSAKRTEERSSGHAGRLVLHHHGCGTDATRRGV